MRKPLIALTMGDPAGIGPEIILKAATRSDVRSRCFLVVFGDAAWLARNLLKLPPKHPAHRLTIAVINSPEDARRAPDTILPVMDLANVPAAGVAFGKINAAAGRASGEYIDAAIRSALRGKVNAIVTAPVNKNSFSLGGWGKKFVGHTEMLAKLTGTKEARLMLVHGSLRAVHVTSHIPLSSVSSSVTRPRVLETIRITDAALRKMGISKPKIALCGLNPHAGDGGVLGTEEKRAIAPAVAAARSQGIRVDGPLSADTVWPLVLAKKYDVGIAMYHDQGQIAIKLQGMGGAVNVTLGLPIVRTSPAHGTAFDIAGRGVASEDSFVAATLMAAKMAASR